MPIDRRDKRTHLFLVATLYVQGASFPVRVRNLSASGGLIEAPNPPSAGSKIVLRRGSLQAPGTVAWATKGQAGISFASVLNVSSWLPIIPPSRQRDVEQLVFGIKHGKLENESSQPLEQPASVTPFSTVVAGLECLQQGLTDLADKLAHDVILVATHPEVQYLDEAVQRIGKIVQIIEMQSMPNISTDGSPRGR